MDFSVTEKGIFKRCQRRHFLTAKSRMNLEPLKGMQALVLGGLVHKSLESWQRNPAIENTYLDHASEAYKALTDDYIQTTGFAPSNEELSPILDTTELGSEMIANYMTYYGTPLPAGYTYIEAEQSIRVEIPKTEHWECGSCHYVPTYKFLKGSIYDVTLVCAKCGGFVTWQSHFLTATLDELVVDHENRVWVLERKTYGNRPRLEALNMNEQFLGYLWVLSKLFGLNNVGGILYDGLWKRSIKKLRGPARKLDELFFRAVLLRAPEEIEEFERQLTIEAHEMASKHTLSSCTMNRRWEGCYDCPVKELCVSISRGEDWEYEIATNYRQRRIEISGAASWIDTPDTE